MSDLFSVVAKLDDENSRETGLRRAKIAAVSRVDSKFAKYVGSGDEAEDRIDFLRQDILDTVVAACNEHGISEKGDVQSVLNDAMASLRVADKDGDSYAKETVTLPKADESGLGSPSPAINKDKVPEKGLDPIDVPSSKNKGEMQEIAPTDHLDKLKEFDPAHSPVHDQVDIESPIGDEQVGDRTKTFSTPEGQSSAVTSSWRIEVE